MKKKSKLLLSLLLTVCFVCIVFSGCESNEPTQTVCILMGNTKNTREAGIDLFGNELMEASKKMSDVSVIVLDGKPDSYDFETTLTDSGNVFYSSQDLLREVQCNILLKYPVENEVDILSGLESAAEKVSSKSDREKQILIYSSGISTAGILNFAGDPDLIYQKTDDILTYIETKLESIDLTNTSIVWYGLGDVADNQRISDIEKKKLKDIWQAVLEECGAENIEFKKYVANSDNENQEFFSQFIQDNSIQTLSRDDFPKVTPVDFKGYINLDESVLEFKSDDYAFVHPDDAESVLKDYAEILSDFQNEKIYIIGSTADDGTDEGCYNLSIKRAQKVKKILCDNGMKDSNLEVIGIGKYPIGGENSKWRVDDSDGSDATQSMNRKVMIIMAGSDEGKLFEKQWNEYKNTHLK